MLVAGLLHRLRNRVFTLQGYAPAFAEEVALDERASLFAVVGCGRFERFALFFSRGVSARSERCFSVRQQMIWRYPRRSCHEAGASEKRPTGKLVAVQLNRVAVDCHKCRQYQLAIPAIRQNRLFESSPRPERRRKLRRSRCELARLFSI